MFLEQTLHTSSWQPGDRSFPPALWSSLSACVTTRPFLLYSLLTFSAFCCHCFRYSSIISPSHSLFPSAFLSFFPFFFQFIVVTIVSKVTQISGVRLCNTSFISQVMCLTTQGQFALLSISFHGLFLVVKTRNLKSDLCTYLNIQDSSVHGMYIVVQPISESFSCHMAETVHPFSVTSYFFVPSILGNHPCTLSSLNLAISETHLNGIRNYLCVFSLAVKTGLCPVEWCPPGLFTLLPMAGFPSFFKGNEIPLMHVPAFLHARTCPWTQGCFSGSVLLWATQQRSGPCSSLLQVLVSFPWDADPKVRWVCREVVLFVIVGGTSILFSKMTAPFYMPTNSVERIQCVHILANTVSFLLLSNTV